MKVGILTFHFAHNYGAMLQAYGLSKYINSIGHKCEIVDYRLRYIYQWVEKYNLISYYHAQREDGFGFIKSVLRTIRYYPRLKQPKDKRWKLFDKFLNSYLPTGHRIYNKNKIGAKYDALVVGSDQIWNADLTDGLQDVYFLNFDFDGKRIAYAASSGQDFVAGDLDYINKTFKKFDYISCRESGLSSYCANLLNRDVPTVCDPIFLLSKDDWTTLCTNRIFNEEYILVYGFNENSLFGDVIKKVSTLLNLPVIRIGNRDLPQLNTETYKIEAGPIEFLTLFNNSSYIITNTFHGVSTAMVFNKQFVAVLPDCRFNRIVNVLRIAKLNDRIVNNIDDIKAIIDSEIDYDKVESNMSGLIEASKKYIQESLENG